MSIHVSSPSETIGRWGKAGRLDGRTEGMLDGEKEKKA